MAIQVLKPIVSDLQGHQSHVDVVTEKLESLAISVKGIEKSLVAQQLGNDLWGTVRSIAEAAHSEPSIREVVMMFCENFVNAAQQLCDASMVQSMLQLSLEWYGTYGASSALVILEPICRILGNAEENIVYFLSILKVRIQLGVSMTFIAI